MITSDEPDHRRLRSLADQAFQRQSITESRPRIEQLIRQQLDRVGEVAQQQPDDGVELVEHFARPVPLAVICEMLGLPREDRPKFRKWFSSFADVKSIWGILRVVPGLRKTMRYLEHADSSV